MAEEISTHDVQDRLAELYDINVSPATESKITDKVWSLVEDWQNHPLARIYSII